MSDLKKAISRLAKTNTGFDAQVELATVTAVNEIEYTCDVTLFDNEDLLLEGVKLKPVVPGTDFTEMGVVCFPVVGSKVLIGQINNSDTDLFVVMCSKVKKVSLDMGSLFNLLMDLQTGNIGLNLAKMVFNKGLNGGLPKVKPTVDKFNRLENKVNDLIKAFNEHKHVGVVAGAAVSGLSDKQATKINDITKLSEIENTSITQ